MKMYTRVVIDMADGSVLEEESYEHTGDVALCKGSSSTTTVDKEYNRRMAAIAERQQGMAEEYFQYWQQYQQPYEKAQIYANMNLLPKETMLAEAQLDAQSEILPWQTALKRAQIDANMNLLPKETMLAEAQLDAQSQLLPGQTDLAKAEMANRMDTIQQLQPVKTQFFQQAAEGVDVNARVGMAQADVANSYKDVASKTVRNMSRMGVGPDSGRFAGMNAANDINQAAAVAGARSQARVGAEQENFARLNQAMAYGMK